MKKDTLWAPLDMDQVAALGTHPFIVDTGYFWGLQNVWTPTAVNSKISGIRDRPEESLLLPKDFDAKCKELPCH